MGGLSRNWATATVASNMRLRARYGTLSPWKAHQAGFTCMMQARRCCVMLCIVENTCRERVS